MVRKYGSCSSLHNLQIDIDLGGLFGNVRGICICKCVEESEWRCGPEYNDGDSFVSKHDDEELVIAL